MTQSEIATLAFLVVAVLVLVVCGSMLVARSRRRR